MATKRRRTTRKGGLEEKDATTPAGEPEDAREPVPEGSDLPLRETGTTLGDLQVLYAEHLDGEYSTATMASYSRELALACAILGEDTLLSALTVEDVRRFFMHDAVMQTADGEPKTLLSVTRTRRVLRLALEWAAEEGLIDEAPLPEPGQ